MALDRPVPGQPLKASSQRDLVGYVEASTPKAGSGVRVVRTAAGSRISSQPSILTVFRDGSSDSFPDGTEIWGRVVYNTTDHKWQQYKMVWSSETRSFVESETPVDIITTVSHSSLH